LRSFPTRRSSDLQCPEFVGDEPEERIRLGLFLRLHLQPPVDVPSSATVDLPGAGRGERLDRDNLARLEEIVAVGDVGDALAGVEQIPLDRVACQIANRTIAVRFDRPLDSFPDRARQYAGMDRFEP